MRQLGWIVLILLIIGGIWYFAFYNDRDELTNDNNSAGIVEENDDLFNISIDQELESSDNGGIFYYLPETRFSILLPETSSSAEIECTPAGSVATVSEVPDAPVGQEAFVFETISEGRCQILIGGFSATINVIDPSKG